MTDAEPGRVIEVKHRLDGSEDRFECDLVEWSRERVVVRFRVDEPGQLLGAVAPALGPLDSYGLFWKRRPYNCYYFVPSDRPLGSPPVLSRFDVVRDVAYVKRASGPDEVRFLDLELDLLVDSEGARWEDEDEVAEATGAGLLSPSDIAYIERARRVLDSGHRRVIAEVRRALRGLAEG